MTHWLGFDLGGTKCAVVLGRDQPGQADGPLEILDRQALATASLPDPLQMLDELALLAGRMLRGRGIDPATVQAGISCGGPLDATRGVIQSPPNLPGWDDVPAVTHLQHRLGLAQCLLENDANAGALAEWRWGAAKGADTALFLTFGTGLGAGVIIHGRLHRGASGMAGELGHWRLADDGPVGYGKAGSFEGFCSGGGLAQEAARRGLSTCDVPTLAGLARQGDPAARALFADTGRRLGQGLAMVVDLLNPEVIVLGSLFIRCADLFAPPLWQALREEALPAALAACQVLPGQLGEAIGDHAALAVALGPGEACPPK